MQISYLTMAQLPLLAYSFNSQDVTGSESITLDPLCNSWTVTNLGDVWVTVNGILLKGYPAGQPGLVGASLGVTGNFGEVYRGLVQINSAQNTPGSGTTQFLCLFIQKVYALD